MSHRYPAAAAVAALLLLPACGEEQMRVPRQDEYRGGGRSGEGGGALGSDGIVLFNSARPRSGSADPGDPGGYAVNAYLWRATLEILSFMPLASADPLGGVVITDWYEPPSASAERFRATAYILGRQLRSDGVRISLFRQEQRGGQWRDAPVTPGVAAELENRVLGRARELRGQPSAEVRPSGAIDRAGSMSPFDRAGEDG